MSILAELNSLLSPILPIETGVFSGEPPNEYLVLTPMTDSFALHADNRPQAETQEVRLSLFSKNNYLKRKSQITAALLGADFTVTGRRYVGYEEDTQYHHYAIDISKEFTLEE